MDAIYEGAEFTIIAAAGDARSSLPGVKGTPRKKQPRVELDDQCRDPSAAAVDCLTLFELLGVTEQDYEEFSKDQAWLDPYYHGLRAKGTIDMEELLAGAEIEEKYNVPPEHFRVFQDFAEDFGNSIEEYMDIMKLLADTGWEFR